MTPVSIKSILIATPFGMLFVLALSLLAEDNTAAASQLPMDYLEITVSNVNPAFVGSLIVNLYTKENWGKPNKAVQKIALLVKNSRTYRVRFSGLQAQTTYAIQAIHDSDNNGKLTMRWLPPGPAEGAGVSNYVPQGIPKFEKAKFLYAGGIHKIAIALVYPK